VLNLAKLARIELGNEEAENLTHEFEAILDYVKEVKGVNTNEEILPHQEDFAVINVMREDILPAGGPHESGLYTQKILEQAPSREGDYIKVKKIL